MCRILAFAGSNRKGSYNRKLIRIAADGARRAGATVTLAELSDYPMPIYDGDLEDSEGLPNGAREFKKLLVQHDGLLIASPEYNAAFSPLLKNALDWASRSESSDEPTSIAYRGKIAAIMSASPAGLGGLRGLVHVRMLLSNLGVMVLPEQQTIKRAGQAFGEDGRLKDQGAQSRVEQLGAALVNMQRKLVSKEPGIT